MPAPAEPEGPASRTEARRSDPPVSREDEERAEAEDVPVATGPGQVPDVRGLSLREAVASLAAREYRARVEGSGVVLAQAPPPGTALAPGVLCSIRLGAPEERKGRPGTSERAGSGRRRG